MSGTIEEKTLLQNSSKGDRVAFSMLYKCYLNDLCRFNYLFLRCRETSEEIAQDAFVKIWENKETLAKVNSFKAYIYRINRNLALNYIRRTQIQQNIFLKVQQNRHNDVQLNEEEFDFKHYIHMAQSAIELLPEKRKAIFMMRTQEELSLDEIAEKLSISKSAVKKQLYAAMDFVRTYLQKYGEITVGIWIILNGISL